MKTLHSLAASLLAATALLSLGGCVDTEAQLREAKTKIAATLPAPYFEDLVTEAVDVDGNRLVLRVRSPVGDAAKTREAPGFDALKESEQHALRELCASPAIMPLIDSDAILVRRFMDRNDALFFEVELPARECLNPPADAPAQP
ncbi:hypothetical protein J2X02_002709 [Pseudoxanthomonas japonensis]|uniref:hypothetical protein n=1 Tax=Pseudoxanthomonas TaxID=83618 RepID=UPI0007821F04|nr:MULTISPECIES: hypothetical protein [Pseudoxanthomonas]MBA3929981.1 hypothetical protein [Xanthomonas sp.]MBL8257399.1 hypothetical protein [Pseudoxanthomonas mexicana]MDR7069858.1 hypothetical protein [Pseudoxanthomonas japonensis]